MSARSGVLTGPEHLMYETTQQEMPDDAPETGEVMEKEHRARPGWQADPKWVRGTCRSEKTHEKIRRAGDFYPTSGGARDGGGYSRLDPRPSFRARRRKTPPGTLFWGCANPGPYRALIPFFADRSDTVTQKGVSVSVRSQWNFRRFYAGEGACLIPC